MFLLDHLPRRSIAFPPITVPYTGAKYDTAPGGFHDYPEKSGYDTEDLLHGNFGVHSLDEGLEFLQSWLFFGLLRETSQVDMDILYERWNRWDGEEGSLVMTSPDLPRHLDMFRKSHYTARTPPAF